MFQVKNSEFGHITLYGPVESSTGVEISTKILLPKNLQKNSESIFILSSDSEMHLKVVLRGK